MLTDVEFEQVKAAPPDGYAPDSDENLNYHCREQAGVVHLHWPTQPLDLAAGEACIRGYGGGWDVCKGAASLATTRTMKPKRTRVLSPLNTSINPTGLGISNTSTNAQTTTVLGETEFFP